MQTEVAPVIAETDNKPPVAHAYFTSDPLPWVSVCGQKIKYSEAELADDKNSQKCVICQDLFLKAIVDRMG